MQERSIGSAHKKSNWKKVQQVHTPQNIQKVGWYHDKLVAASWIPRCHGGEESEEARQQSSPKPSCSPTPLPAAKTASSHGRLVPQVHNCMASQPKVYVLPFRLSTSHASPERNQEESASMLPCRYRLRAAAVVPCLRATAPTPPPYRHALAFTLLPCHGTPAHRRICAPPATPRSTAASVPRLPCRPPLPASTASEGIPREIERSFF